MADYTLVTYLLLSLLIGYTETQSSRLMCRLKCGVIVEDEEVKVHGTSRIDLVRTAWSELRFQKGIIEVDIQFVPIRRRSDITMDILVEAYMEIGTTNISAMIGPYVEPLATTTEKFGIPYFVTSPPQTVRYRPYNMIVVYPNDLDAMLVAADVARKYEWRDLALIYDNNDGMHLVERLVLYPALRVRSWRVIPEVSRKEVRDIMLTIRRLSITNVILFTMGDVARTIMDEALHLSMLSSHYSWMLPNMTLSQEDLERYIYTQINFTTFRLMKSFVTDLHIPKPFERNEYINSYDSLLTLYHGIKNHHKLRGSCHWIGKAPIYSTLHKIGDNGATGWLSFGEDGSRQGYVVGVYGLGMAGLYQMGFWNSSERAVLRRLRITDTNSYRQEPVSYPLGKEIVQVVTVLEDPFVRLKEDQHLLSGNDRFEGFAIDLLSNVAAILQFKYQIYIAPDGLFGHKTQQGTWTGVIGELLNGNASLAVAPLAITSDRKEVIDFTEPFFTTSYSIVMQRHTQRHSMFHLLSPLSLFVWVLMIVVFLVISTTLYIVDRLAPGSGNESSKHRLTASDSLWFTFASMVLRVTDIVPRSISSRILAGSLWLFSIIMISTYTANLAAFLTVFRFSAPVQSIQDLALQNHVSYGTVRASHVSAFFANSKLPHLQRMWYVMSGGDQAGMVNSTQEGFDRVANSRGDFAFLWETYQIRLRTSINCDLYEVGQTFGLREYGLGVPKGTHYRDKVSIAILRLRENGKLQELEHRWFHNRKCKPTSPTAHATDSISIEDVAGLFIILGAGVVLALGTSLFEYCYRIKRRRKATKNRKVPEHESAYTKPLCDGNMSSGGGGGGGGALQLEESFLSPVASYTGSKQTQIF